MIEGNDPGSELEKAKIERAARKKEFITLSKEFHERMGENLKRFILLNRD